MSPGITLVETMMSLVIFSVIILGSIALTTFSLRNMDGVRTVAQVSRILTQEMESMRMRGWKDRTDLKDANTGAAITLYGLKSLGIAQRESDGKSLLSITDDTENPLQSTSTPVAGGNFSHASTTYAVQPFAVYGSRNAASTGASTIGKEVVSGASVQLVPPTGFTMRRTVTLKRSSDGGAVSTVSDVDYAEITLTATWEDKRGTHTRSLFTTLSKNGLSDFYHLSLP
jgi:hypothetical protein